MNHQLALPVPPERVRTRRPSEPIVRSASIEGCYRWTATRAWGSGRTVLWVPLNPSDADGRRDDPTMWRMMSFSFRWGFGSMVVANVYPFISSTTDKLRAWRKTFDHKTYEANGMRPWDLDKSTWSAFHHNQAAISKLLTPETVCVAAWGNGVDDADLDHFLRGVRLQVEDEEFGDVGVEVDWHCLGKTASGAPIHPLARGKHRVPDDAALQIWKRKPRARPERSSCL